MLSKDIVQAQRVLVIGSCLSHDVCKAFWGSDIKYAYLWRLTTPSLLCRVPAEAVDVSEFSMSREESITFNRDMYKNFDLESEMASADVIVIDLIRETYDVIELDNGSFVTRGVEYDKYDILSKISIKNRYDFGTLAHFNLWLEAFKKLTTLLTQCGKPHILIKAKFAHVYYMNYNFELISDYTQINILKRNIVISWMNTIAEGMLRSAGVLQMPEYVNFAWPDHPWGRNPAHYSPRVIKTLAGDLRTAMQAISSKNGPGAYADNLETNMQNAIETARSTLGIENIDPGSA